MLGDLPGGPVVKTPRLQCMGHGFHPCSGNQDPTCPHGATKIKKGDGSCYGGIPTPTSTALTPEPCVWAGQSQAHGDKGATQLVAVARLSRSCHLAS